jgi:hypothetical protein
VRNVLEAASDISIQHIFGLLADTIEDGANRIMYASPRAESVTVPFKLGLPLRFQSAFHQRLVRAVQHGGNTKWALLITAWLRNPDPAGRLRLDRVHVTQAMHQEQAICRRDGFDPVDSCSTLALIVRRDASDGEGTSSSRLEEEPLQTVDHFTLATS